MRKLTAIVMATSLALGAANLAHAAETATTATAPDATNVQPYHKGMRGPHHDMMFNNLNLTDAQKQQIREIMKAQRDKMKRPSLDERRAMHALVASDTFDRAKAEETVNKMAEQHKEMMLSRMETQNKIYNILTPEQKKQFNANFEKRLTERPAKPGKMPVAAE
ncbi:MULTISPECIES: ATP-independent periplasmic protein-refolding chaperone Spy [Atlantibacter]|uniref:ATP-independent periplasmic protein-refolding chaperone Spy n=1 Tax=Atlantibacter TaxID=1903434 RepID=UPI0016059560|nr:MULTISPECIES: ATP-independent periplasmic protein-refolding chaperone Spy [Atlantibacter]MBB3320804.1 Spy/CpxP family protein refolding chaperone [Atlantibacter sp. RC6]MBL7636244.1 ATP-independent periplasmic protein-refolding chaperone [Atlantibacter hermannii]MBL7673792.1 ATP-independent periplasmic protein-refolding chaperone [Atlantibacter hermannii]